MGQPANTDLSLSEFVYTVARQMPISKRRHLPEKYFKKVANDKAAQRFATMSSIEQKKEFLAYMGIEYITIFVDTDGLTGHDIRTYFGSFQPLDQPQTTMKKMAEENVFVSSGREFCYNLLHTAMLANKPLFRKAHELARVSYHTQNWGNKIGIAEYKNRQEEKDIIERLSNYTLRVMNAAHYSFTVTELDLPALTILLYLYEKKAYVSRQKIELNFTFSKRQIASSLKVGIEKMFIQKHPRHETKQYIITSTGILAINRFIEKVNKSLEL